jgi:hypothetical protein
VGTLPDGFSASRLDSRPNRTTQATVRTRRPHDNFRVRVRSADATAPHDGKDMIAETLILQARNAGPAQNDR